MGPDVAAAGGGVGRHSQRGRRDWLVRDQWAGLGTLNLNLVTRKPMQSFEQRKDMICFCFGKVTMIAWGVLPRSRDQFDATEVTWTTEYASSA